MLQAVEDREKRLKQLSLMIHKAMHCNEVKRRREKRKEDIIRESMTVGLHFTSAFIKSLLSPPRKLRPKPKQVSCRFKLVENEECPLGQSDSFFSNYLQNCRWH